jgi:hypothetical protein
VVQDKKSKNFGNETWSPVGFYNTPGGALFGAVKQNLMEDKQVQSLDQLLTRFEYWAKQFGCYREAVKAAEIKLKAMEHHKKEATSKMAAATRVDKPKTAVKVKKKRKPKRTPKRA